MNVLAMLMLAAQNLTGHPLPAIPVQIPYMPGQREVVTGALPYPDTMMQVIYQNDLPASFPSTGNGNIVMGGLVEKALGWTRWSVLDRQTELGKPCRKVSLLGDLKQSIDRIQFESQFTMIWWVDNDNHILRQYEDYHDPWVHRRATCVYGTDSIDMMVDDEKGRRQTTMFPSCGLDKLNDQFKPMIQDGNVLIREKEFYVLDPFNGLQKYTARISGTVSGEVFRTKFKGKTIDIVGPKLTETACLDEAGDLVQVNLPNNRMIIMQSTPPGWQTIHGG